MALTKVSRGLLSTSIVDNGNATAITIDANENVGIGNSGVASTRFAVTGSVVGANIETTSSNAGHEGLIVNRQNSDGTAIAINRAGTTAGSISVEGGDLAIGNDDAGIQFVNGTEHFRPFNITTNAATDALMDIGSSSKRFKDLYLSGGAYLGGTGSANHLDDYEEGTWTPVLVQTGNTVTHSAQFGIFVKVGRSVFISGLVSWSAYTNGTGAIEIDGMPFNVKNVSSAYSQIASFDHGGIPYTSGRTTFGLYAGINTDKARLLLAGSGLNTTIVSSISSVGFIYFSGTFYTDS